MSWKNQESWEPWLNGFWVNRHSKMQKKKKKFFFRFWATIMDLLTLWYQILLLLIWYQEQLQPGKYCLSRISTSRIIKLKKWKIQFFSLFAVYFHFFIFVFKTYASLKRFLLSAEINFYIYFMSLVGFQVSKIWKFFWKIYCVASFKIICQHKSFP